MKYHQIMQNEFAIALLAAGENEREKIGQEIQENLNQVLITALLYIAPLAKTDDESREKKCNEGIPLPTL